MVHGAWFGGWVWDQVAQALRSKGHVVHAPSLTGLGDKQHLSRRGINLTTHADDIVELIEREQLNEVVLVGWSYGGMVTSEVLARIPARIGAMVYLDAFVPERGRSVVDYTSALTASESSTAEQKTEATSYTETVEDLEPASFDIMGVTDPSIIDHAAPRLCRHPIGTFMQPSNALLERPSHIPHVYILAGASPTAALFRPVMERVAQEPCFRTETLDTSHLMMLTAPAEIVRILAACETAAPKARD